MSNKLLDDVKSMNLKGTNSIAEGYVASAALPYVKEGADYVLPEVAKNIHLNSTFDYPTGLRHFMPINMAFGAPWAGYMLGFEKSKYKWHTNYTSVSGKTMWQSTVGYTSMYDFFFSLGGPIFRRKYDFKLSNNAYYVVWVWKGDYWNLGAGAEIGIYFTSSEENKRNEFYEVDTNLLVRVHMKIQYKILGRFTRELNDFEQTNWWVCSFTPIYQMPNVDWIEVNLKVEFDDGKLMKPFYETYIGNQKDPSLSWDEVTMAPTPYKSRAKNHETHKCSSVHPTQCVCRSYTCCSKPCRYYSDNGYQFYIDY